MKRYIHLYNIFVKNCFIRELEFRFNFFSRVLLYLGWSITGIFVVSIIFGKVEQLGEWNKERVMLVYVIFLIANSIYKTIFHVNLKRLIEYIRKGDLDFLLLKPVNLRYLVSVRYVRFDQIPRIALFIFLVIRMIPSVNPNVTFIEILLSSLVLIFGIFGIYNLNFIISCVVFWRPLIWNVEALFEPIKDFGQYPTDIYKGTLGSILKLIPIALFATIPTKIILGEQSFHLILYTVIITIIFFLLSVIIWKAGLRRYESASS